MSSDSEEDENLKHFLEECVDKEFARGSAELPEKKLLGQKEVKVKEKSTEVSRKPSKRSVATAEVEDYEDLTPGMKTYLSKQLDNMLEKVLQYQDTTCEKSEDVPELGIKLFSSTKKLCTELIEESRAPQTAQRRSKKTQKIHEKVPKEELASIAVSADWVLNKRGVYGNGRERQGELVTGAVHSPRLSKTNSDSVTSVC